MSTHKIGIFLIAHPPMCHALLRTVQHVYGELFIHNMKNFDYFAVKSDLPIETQLLTAHKKLKKINPNAGGILLTDLPGSSPANLAQMLLKQSEFSLKLLTGVNLPMLLRLMNYAHEPLEDLVEKALAGGHDGIHLYVKNQKENIT